MKTNHRRAAATTAHDNKNDAPALVDEEYGVRLSTSKSSNNDDDEDEEEMISLGLTREDSLLLASSNSNEQDNANINAAAAATTATNNVSHGIDNNGNTPARILMVGTNRKSAFPATPAGVPTPIRRTPGPMSAAQQARHRRTPGAGHSHNDADLGRSHARTPVMSGGGGNRQGKTPHKLSLASPSLVTPSNKSQNTATTAIMETPNLNNTGNKTSNNNGMNQHQSHQRQLYTPAHFTLAKNLDLDLHMDNNRPAALSPATIRMTDSLEKILTDDDDYMEAKQRLLLVQQQSQVQQQAVQLMQEKDIVTPNNRKNNNGNHNVTLFDSYKAQDSPYHLPRTLESDTIAMAGRGAFRRIQSTGSSSEDSADDEEMEEMNHLDNGTTGEDGTDELDDGLSSQEEDEAEISQINDDEEDVDDDINDTGEANADASSISRPKPLNFDRPSGLNNLSADGGPSSAVSASSGGAFEPAKRAIIVPTTGWTMPRQATAPIYHPVGSEQGHHHHLNQGQVGGGMYYAQPQPQQGYFGHNGGAEGMMGGHPAPNNMLFNEQQPLHQPHAHVQYPHPPPDHHPYGPPPPHHPHHPSQNFHLPPMGSPQNAGFGQMPPPTGVVSPLTIPDYSHGAYHPHSYASTIANNVGGGSYPHHHSMHTIQGGNTGAVGGDHWWSGSPSGHADSGVDGPAAGFDHTMLSQQHGGMHHPHHQGGMGGMMSIPGHASPEFSFYEMSGGGAVSPFTLPHLSPYSNHAASLHHHPPTHHAHTYPLQHPHHHSQGAAPIIHYPGAAVPAAARPRTKSKDHGSRPSRTHNNRKAASPLTLISSPSKQQHHGSPPGKMRPRKDSATGVNSAYSGADEQQQQGGISYNSNSHQQRTISSPNNSSQSASTILRHTLPGLNTSASSEEGMEHTSNWFHPANQNTSTYSPQQQVLKGRARKGSQEPLGAGTTMTMQNMTGPGNISNHGSRLSVAERKQQQQGMKKPLANKQPRDRQVPHHLDLSQMKTGPTGGSEYNDDAKHPRGEFIVESPTERQAFKEFGRHFRQRENESLTAAQDYALACLSESNNGIYLPPATHWRVYLELADVVKRSNRIEDARGYYRQACKLQPCASQGWLEHSKLEEESGNLRKCAGILQEGLQHCTTNENLLIRAVKFYERMGDLDQARQLLSRLKYCSIDKSWKTMLEGALLEARAGRYTMAREVLKFLTHNVPWYGPLYLAHTKLERDYGLSPEAYSIVEKGLKELPRYGPLYFQAFRLLEKEDLSRKAFDLPRTMGMVSRADSISRELLWKVHLEAAQMQERAAVLAVEDNTKNLDLRTALKATRRSYAKAIMLCPPNLSWKIWLASGRTEVSCGNTNVARELFLRAYDSVSEKGRSTVLLECARLEEYCGDLALSRSILCKSRQQFGKSDWKVWLSSVNLECRCGLRERAIAFAQEALNIHRGTGRLWAALIQLRHDEGELYQMKVLKFALQAVPKSGEVWCEGARIYLNPFSPTFDLQAASRHLSFAARFTPQYGDSFLEQLRVNMIDQWLIPMATPFINGMQDAFLSCNQMQIEDAYKFIAEHTRRAADIMKTQLKETSLVAKDVLDTSKLELRCSSADPNYGHLWFQCRSSPIDTAREVIVQAKTVMADSIIDYSYLYIAAMVRRAGVLMLIYHQAEKNTAPATNQSAQLKLPAQGLPRPNSHSWDLIVDKQLRLAPPLDDMLSASDAGSILFTTGCVRNNHNWDKSSLTEKRRILFGSDSLLS